MAGLQAGDYHIGLDIGNDQYEVLKDYAGVIAEILTPTNWDVFFLNWESPMMKNLAMRQAVQLAMDPTPQLQSGRGGGDFIRLDPGLMMQQTAWYTEAGEEHYNVNDPEAAKAKLQEAGYDGEPLRFMTTQEYSYMYGEAIVAKQQLEDIGITVDFRVTDWATVLENRAKKDAWEMFGTGHGFVPDPSQISYVGQMNIYPGLVELGEQPRPGRGSARRIRLRYPVRASGRRSRQRTTRRFRRSRSATPATCSFRSDKLGGWDAQFERGREVLELLDQGVATAQSSDGGRSHLAGAPRYLLH